MQSHQGVNRIKGFIGLVYNTQESMKHPSNLLFIPMDLMIYLKSVADKISSIVSTIDMNKSDG